VGVGGLEVSARGLLGMWIGRCSPGASAPTEGLDGLGDHTSTPGRCVCFESRAATNLRRTNKDARERARARATTTQCVSLLSVAQGDGSSDWSSVGCNGRVVTARLLSSKPLGRGNASTVVTRSLKGKDDPLGRYAFTTWEGGRSYTKCSLRTEAVGRETTRRVPRNDCCRWDQPTAKIS
jgi:hypothetical protein